jgi:hypothetical protein
MKAALPAALVLAGALGQAMAADSDNAALRARAIEKCKANRGVDCATESGLREWVEAERKRPSGQRSPLMQQKLEAERRAQKNGTK